VKGVLWKVLDLSMYFDGRWAWSHFKWNIYIDTHTLFSIRFNTIKQNVSNVLYRGNCVKILLNMNKFKKVVTSTIYKGERCSILYVKLLYRIVCYVFDIEGKVLEIKNYGCYDKIMYVVKNFI